jgi:ribosomal protein L28
MAFKCDNCSKGVMVGQTHKHHPGVAGGRWKKRAPHKAKLFRPNLHSARVLVGTNYQRLKLCTKCLRLAKEAMKMQKETTTQPFAA